LKSQSVEACPGGVVKWSLSLPPNPKTTISNPASRPILTKSEALKLPPKGYKESNLVTLLLNIYLLRTLRYLDGLRDLGQVILLVDKVDPEAAGALDVDDLQVDLVVLVQGWLDRSDNLSVRPEQGAVPGKLWRLINEQDFL